METKTIIPSSESLSSDTRKNFNCVNVESTKFSQNIDINTTKDSVVEINMSENVFLQNHADLKNEINQQNPNGAKPEIIKNSAVISTTPIVNVDQKDLSIEYKCDNETVENNNPKNSEVPEYVVVEKKVTDGCWSWVVLIAAMFSTVLMGSSYVFFSLIYRDIVEEFETTTANAGWIGSVHVACVNVFGIPIGIAIDILGPRKVASFGVVMSSFGFFLSSFAHNVATMVFTYGFLTGIGLGIMACCSMIQTLNYFDKKRPLGAALFSCGHSIGAIVTGPILNIVFEHFSWRSTFLLFASFTLQILVLIVWTFKPQKKVKVRMDKNMNEECDITEKIEPLLLLKQEETKREMNISSKIMNDCSRKYRVGKILLTDPVFAQYTLSCFFLYIGTQCYVQHLPKRASELGIDRKKVSYIPISCSTVSIVMKIASGIIANLPGVNRLLMFATAVFGSGVSQFLVPLCTTFKTILLHGVFEGIFRGIIFSIFSVNLVDLKGINNITLTQPIIILSFGIAALISTPFAGFLYDKFNYDVTFITTGCILILGSLCSFNVLRLVKRQEHKQKVVER